MLPNVRLRLSLMMFLQFFIWGAWYVTMGTYLANALKADGVQIGAAYSAMAIATIISPFFVGMIADRFFSAQKLMGVLHISGAEILNTYLLDKLAKFPHFQSAHLSGRCQYTNLF